MAIADLLPELEVVYQLLRAVFLALSPSLDRRQLQILHVESVNGCCFHPSDPSLPSYWLHSSLEDNSRQ